MADLIEYSRSQVGVKKKYVDQGDGSYAELVAVVGGIAQAAAGATGAAAPAQALQVGGTDGTNLRAIKVDADGTVNVNSELPAAAALADGAANPTTVTVGVNPSLWSGGQWNRQLSLGQITDGASGANGAVQAGRVAMVSGSAVYKLRVPNIFKTVVATAAGDTAIWTPTTSKKWRLLQLRVEVTADAALAAAADLDITFKDGATALGLGTSVFVPAAAGTAFGPSASTGWVDLGGVGILSAAANNVLYANLSAALTSGKVRFVLGCTEE